MKYLVILLFIGTILSCSSSRIIKTEMVSKEDFSKYKTFNFYKLAASGDTLSEKYEQRVNLLKTAIANELVKKGYRQVSENADLLVNIGISVKEQIQTRQTDFRTDAPRYIGQRNYTWKSQEIEVGRYRLGTADIHLIDAKKGIMVWRKIEEGVIPDKDKKLEEKVKEGMKKIFLNFPVSV